MSGKEIMINKDLISLIDHFPGGMGIVDPKGNIIALNSTLAKIFNKSREELIGMNGYPFFEDNTRKNRGNAVKNVIQDKKPAVFIDYERGHWWKTILIPELDSSEEVSRIYFFFTDISDEMKNQQDKLLSQEEYYISMIEHSMDMTGIVDKTGKFLYLSPSIERILKYQIPELLQKNMFETAFIKEKKKVQDYFDSIISKPGLTDTITYQIKDKKGSIHYFESIANNQLHNPIINGIIINSRDVTEREQAKINLEKQKRFLDNVMNSTTEIIFTVNQNHKITLWNDAARRITGLSPKQVVGKHIKKLKMFENLSEFEEYINNIFNKKHGILSHIIIKSIFGGKRLWSVSCSPISTNNIISEIVFICNDITLKDELHGKLIPGKSYLIDDDSSLIQYDMFNGLLKDGWSGLCLTRSKSEIPLESFSSSSPKILVFSNFDSNDNEISNLDECYESIKRFVENTSSPAVNMDRVDYLIARFGFNDVLNLLYKVNDLIRYNSGLLLLRINSVLLSSDKIGFLYEEFDKLPSLQIKEVFLQGELFDVLNFILKETEQHKVVNQTHICEAFNISKVTAQKRTNDLLDQRLIISKKQGRSKNLYVTDKGKVLLNKKPTL